MKIPLIVYAMAGSQVLVPLAGFRLRGALVAPRRWIVVWGLVLVLTDLIQLVLGFRHINNLWVSYFFSPFEVAALLIGLSLWHSEPAWRRAFQYAAIGFVIVEILLVIAFERLDQFSVLVGPLKALLLLVASAATLLACVRRHEGDLLREDWLWICLGLALRYGVNATVEPLSAALAPTDPGVLLTAFKIKAWFGIVASLVIARGILCPVLPRPSSGPSSPAFSPSPSSSPRSAPPS